SDIGLATSRNDGFPIEIPLLHGGGFWHWQPVHVSPPGQSAFASQVSAPQTSPSPHTTGRAAHTHPEQPVHGSAQVRPGSPHCSPGSIVPSPQWTSCCS